MFRFRRGYEAGRALRTLVGLVVATRVSRVLRVLLTAVSTPARGYAPAMFRLRYASPMPFARQVLALQAAVLIVVVGFGFALVGWLFDNELTQQYGARALAVAHTVAADPAIGEAAAIDDPGRALPGRAEAARAASGALFVVITNRDGIRLAHPNPKRIHELVSTDPSAVLNGHDTINVERGTLGLSARGKTPLRDAHGGIVGEVSVGFDVTEIRGYVVKELGLAAVFAGGALLLGIAGSVLLTRRLKRLTLGLEPHELAELVQEREAVLHGVSEGVLAVDAAGRVSVCNTEARRLLGVRPSPGDAVAALALPPSLHTALGDREAADNLITVAGDRVLIANYRTVRRDGRDLGGVLTLRDRTDLENITRELDSVRTLSTALRAQRHEFANRLHVLSGLLRNGHRSEALEFLHAVSDTAVPATGPAVSDPYLQAFVSAKTAEAAEKGARLALADTSWVGTRVTAPVEVTTVLGILVDNALDAAWRGARRPAWVDLALLEDAGTLHISVVDSGDGVAAALGDRIFVAGVSTRDGEGRGLGLALARQAARRLGGDVRLAVPAGEEHGAVFEARLPATLQSLSDVEPEVTAPPCGAVGSAAAASGPAASGLVGSGLVGSGLVASGSARSAAASFAAAGSAAAASGAAPSGAVGSAAPPASASAGCAAAASSAEAGSLAGAGTASPSVGTGREAAG
jgi:two-component system, CitB family, sensor kinase